MSFWDDSGYELGDPKHPDYSERMAEWADLERKRRREDAVEPEEDDAA